MYAEIRHILKNRLRTAVCKGLLRFFAVLPLRLCHGLGAALGWFFAVTPNELRRVTRINLQLCLPDLTVAERRHIERASLIESAKGLFETAALWCWPPGRVLPLVTSVQGEHHVRAAMAQGRGVIMVLTHLGAWEMLGLYLGAHYGVTTLFRPLRIHGLNAFVRTARERTGAQLVPTDTAGVRHLYDTLGEGGMVWISIDQEPSMGTGVFAPYFGVSAKTAVLLPRLVLRTRAPVIYACAERLPHGKGFQLHFVPHRHALVDNDLAATARNLNRGAEALIRSKAAQYLWSYKRFRSRPEREAGVY